MTDRRESIHHCDRDAPTPSIADPCDPCDYTSPVGNGDPVGVERAAAACDERMVEAAHALSTAGQGRDIWQPLFPQIVGPAAGTYYLSVLTASAGPVVSLGAAGARVRRAADAVRQMRLIETPALPEDVRRVRVLAQWVSAGLDALYRHAVARSAPAAVRQRVERKAEQRVFDRCRQIRQAVGTEWLPSLLDRVRWGSSNWYDELHRGLNLSRAGGAITPEWDAAIHGRLATLIGDLIGISDRIETEAGIGHAAAARMSASRPPSRRKRGEQRKDTPDDARVWKARNAQEAVNWAELARDLGGGLTPESLKKIIGRLTKRNPPGPAAD